MRISNDYIMASIAELKADGWAETKRAIEPCTYWPASQRIIMEKSGMFLEYSFMVRNDDSDFAGEDADVSWYRVALDPITVHRVRRLMTGEI